MEICRYERMPASCRGDWLELMDASGLSPGEDADYTVLIYEDGKAAAAGSRSGNILKYLAVSEEMQGLNLTATLITELQKNAFSAGVRHLFLYTKPKNRLMFEELHFYPVAKTADVLLMENERNGITNFLRNAASSAGIDLTEQGADGRRSGSAAQDAAEDAAAGAVVMNCDPFTLGHRYLIETAAKKCEKLYVFVLSEDKSCFPAEERMELVIKGTADLGNVTVLPTGDYLISSATFPDYFLKKTSSATQAQCALDCKVFGTCFAPFFGITKRFAGSEPFSEVTAEYNRLMSKLLPEMGIEFEEIQRKNDENGSPISASRVRAMLNISGRNGAGASAARMSDEPDELDMYDEPDESESRRELVRRMVPDTTLEYLAARGYI